MYIIVDLFLTAYENFVESRFKKSEAKRRKRVRQSMAKKSRYKDSIIA